MNTLDKIRKELSPYYNPESIILVAEGTRVGVLGGTERDQDIANAMTLRLLLKARNH